MVEDIKCNLNILRYSAYTNQPLGNEDDLQIYSQNSSIIQYLRLKTTMQENLKLFYSK